MAIGVNVSMNVYLFLCVSTVIEWQPVWGVYHLLHHASLDGWMLKLNKKCFSNGSTNTASVLSKQRCKNLLCTLFLTFIGYKCYTTQALNSKAQHIKWKWNNEYSP